jgi:ABC-2 type transport system permease protein
MTAIGPLRSMWLLARLRLQRLLNIARTRPFGAATRTRSRAATAAKKRPGWVLLSLLTVLMMLSFLNIASHSVRNIQCQLDPSSQCLAPGRNDTNRNAHLPRIEPSASDAANRAPQHTPFAAPVLIALTMQLMLLFLFSVLAPLGTREIAQAEWDFEWLVTLPLGRSVLIAARLFERTLVNPTGALTLGPLIGTIAWFSGYRWVAPVIAVAGAIALLSLAALIRTVIDTGLKLALPPSQLRNLQAMASVFGLPCLYLAMAPAMPDGGGFVLGWARVFPHWTLWTPPGLVLQSINAGASLPALGLLALLLAQIAAVLGIGITVLRHQLRHGVVAAGSRESARRNVALEPGGRLTRFYLRSPIQRRELRLLARDRNFLVQSVLLPVIMVGSQTLLNGRLVSMSQIGGNATLMVAIAFGIGSYMLMLSAFQTLNSEGPALWMLYTFPQSIESVLMEKAQLWAALALLYPAIILAVTAWSGAPLPWETVALFGFAFAGIPVYAVIAVALGVFACDPLAQDARTKVRSRDLYFYMLLSSVYVYAIYVDAWSQRLAVFLLAATLAQALWQKARDEIPFLLDSSATPPARVSTADGIIAAILFFVLQSVVLDFLTHRIDAVAGQLIFMAYGIAGAVVYAIMRLFYWRANTQGVPRLLGKNLKRVLAVGFGAGFVATAIGLTYLYVLQNSSFNTLVPLARSTSRWRLEWLFLLAVVAAPLTEEFIFRGLIFGGRRRSVGFVPAMLTSAALFAIVHPPAAMLPVFALGLCTAFAYERTKSLLAPMLVHAMYNASVLASPLVFQSLRLSG